MYIIRDYGSNGFVMEKYSGIASCDAVSSQIDISSLPNGEYYAVIQGYKNQIGSFSVRQQCITPPPQVSKELLMGLVFGTCGCIILIFIIYYLYDWTKYIKSKPTGKPVSKRKRGRATHAHAPSFSAINQDDDEEHSVEMLELAGPKSPKKETAEHKEEEDVVETDLDIRRLETDRTLIQQLNDNEDAVQLVLKHAIQSCIDQNGFDLYQVLAVRYYNAASRKITGIKPFSKIGINIEFISLSSFSRTVFTAIIIGLTQTFGITVVVYNLME
eukprot:230753_1